MNQLARRIAMKIVNNDSEYEGKLEMIRFGVEIFLMVSLGVSLMVIISILYGVWWLWIPFLLGFAPLRNFGGGFHSKTPVGCLICSELIFFIAINLSMCDMSTIVLLLLYGISFLIVVHWAPVQAENKPLSEKLRKANRKKCLIVIFMQGFLILMFAKVEVVKLFCLGMFEASVSMAIAIILERRKRYEKTND